MIENLHRLMIPAVMAVALVCSCTEKAPVEEVPEEQHSISVSNDLVKAGPDGDKVPVTVTSSGPWRLSGKAAWVEPSVTEGEDGDEIVFDVARNTTGETLETVFKVFSGDATQEITVLSEPGYYMRPVNMDETYTFLRHENILKLCLDTNVSEKDIKCSFTGNEDGWLEFTGVTPAFGMTYLFFDLAENTTWFERKSEITVSGQGFSVSTKVIQRPTYVAEVDNKMINSDGLDGGDISITVRTNADITCEIPSGCDWITIKEQSDMSEPDEEGLSKCTLTLTLDASRVSRLAEIGFVYDGETLASVSVTQCEPGAVIGVISQQELADLLVSQGLMTDQGNSLYQLTETGKACTEVSLDWPSGSGPLVIGDLGIFPQMTALRIGTAVRTTTLDLSDCKTLTSLSIKQMSALSEVITGSSPLESFVYGTDNYNKLAKGTLTVSGDNLKKVDIGTHSDYSTTISGEGLTAIDVSGCPALVELNAARGFDMEGYYKLTTIRMTSAQMEKVGNGITVTKFENTKIVAVD